MNDESATVAGSGTESRPAAGARVVRKFREILIWPLQLEPLARGEQIHRHWEVLTKLPGGDVWKEVDDEFTGDPKAFQERHYGEFVTFLPQVQRFLYGEGPCRAVNSKSLESSLRVFRRSDIRELRITPDCDGASHVLGVKHVDLYFFYDLDVALLNVEVSAEDLTLTQAEEVMYRFGRAYPASWSASGEPQHCLQQLEWLGAEGQAPGRTGASARQGA